MAFNIDWKQDSNKYQDQYQDSPVFKLNLDNDWHSKRFCKTAFVSRIYVLVLGYVLNFKDTGTFHTSIFANHEKTLPMEQL